MTLRARFVLALLFVVAVGAQAQMTVRLEEVPTLPVNPTTRTKVQARVIISGCGDLTITPVVHDDNIIELRHRVEHCPIMPLVIEDSIDLGFLPAGKYTLRVITLDPSNPGVEDSDDFTVTEAPQALCTPGPLVACLFGRFQVRVAYRAEFTDGVTNRFAKVLNVPALQGTVYESALFYLADPANAEVMVKMLDQGTDALGRPVVAVLYGTATPLKIEIDVQDRDKNVTKVYSIPLGQMQGGADFTAFVK